MFIIMNIVILHKRKVDKQTNQHESTQETVIDV